MKEVSKIVDAASAKASEDFCSKREELVRVAHESIEPLIDEYFDIIPLENILIDDTLQVIIPSVRPTRRRAYVPTIEPSKKKQWDIYTKRLCDTLNEWGKSGPFIVQGRATASEQLGIGVAVLQKIRASEVACAKPAADLGTVLSALERLREVASHKPNGFELIRGAKVFDQDHLYLVKPIGQRFWTQTAALNDADEIAGTILMHTPQEVA